MFECAAIFEVGGDSGRTEGMIADLGGDVGGRRPALDHAVHVLVPHRLGTAGLAADRAKEGTVIVATYAGSGDVVI